MNTLSKILAFLTAFALLAAYVVLVITGHTTEARDFGETIATIIVLMFVGILFVWPML